MSKPLEPSASLAEWFNQAIELPQAEREALLARADQVSLEFGAELRELLSSHQEAGDFLEAPATNPWMLATLEREATQRPFPFPPGEKLAGFRIKRHLGTGAFSHVYLADDEVLEREVAIKVSYNRGAEARRMAPLVHDGIVTVYSEKQLPERNIKVICMQYVAGCTLQEMLIPLHLLGRPWSGKDFLGVLDQASDGAASFNPALYKEREAIEGLCAGETVLHLGIKLCSALSFAHQRGVLHFDVKPANIMMTPYGRALLADFNTAVLISGEESSKGPSGGTPGYMSPEQYRVLSEPMARESLTPASDLYSLSVVLVELLTGKRPRDHAEAALLLESSPEIIRRVLLSCIQTESEARARSADELALTLENALQIYRAQKRIATFRLGGNPVVLLLAAMLGPQLIGSALNISYNSLQIMTELSQSQREIFTRLVLAYNAITYSLGLLLICRFAAPLFRHLTRSLDPSDEDPTRLRRITLKLPWVLALVCSLGWLPGTWIFPFGIDRAAGPIEARIYSHFTVSICLSWLVAFSYSFLLLVWVSLNRIYPRLWSYQERLGSLASKELRPIRIGLRVSVAGCGLIPLLGAIIAIGFGPNQATQAATLPFKLLLVALIGAGMVGFGFALLMFHSLREQLLALERSG